LAYSCSPSSERDYRKRRQVTDLQHIRSLCNMIHNTAHRHRKDCGRSERISHAEGAWPDVLSILPFPIMLL
jgi:hypothetical protein